MTVPENQAASVPNDLQTTQGVEDAKAAEAANAADLAKRHVDNMEAQAELKRKSGGHGRRLNGCVRVFGQEGPQRSPTSRNGRQAERDIKGKKKGKI